MGELETWNRKYAEVMEGSDRAEALWLATAVHNLVQAGLFSQLPTTWIRTHEFWARLVVPTCSVAATCLQHFQADSDWAEAADQPWEAALELLRCPWDHQEPSVVERLKPTSIR